jgi:hypothetical protein
MSPLKKTAIALGIEILLAVSPWSNSGPAKFLIAITGG